MVPGAGSRGADPRPAPREPTAHRPRARERPDATSRHRRPRSSRPGGFLRGGRCAHGGARVSPDTPGTAALVDRHCVSVKVAREERPDVDQIYMQAVQSMTGPGGWPMTCFLTPLGEPFYGGTYFPPVERHGLPAFPRLLQALADAWANRRGEVTASARPIRGALAPADPLPHPAQP